MFAGLTFLAVAAAGLFWRGYRRPRPRRWLIPRRPAVRVGAARPNAPAVADSVRAARACRDGQVDPAALLRSGVPDHLAAIAGRTAPCPDPTLVAAVAEAERLARRLPHWLRHLPAAVRTHTERLHGRLAETTELRRRWLRDSTRRLVAAWPGTRHPHRPAVLDALADLRADLGGLFPTIPGRRTAYWAEAVRALRWSKSPHVGPELVRHLPPLDTGSDRAAAVLAALRGHRSEAAEDRLLRAATGTDLAPRRAAVGAFGWWDPFDPGAVLTVLEDARLAADADTRQAALYALARFGDRSALSELADGLRTDDPAARWLAAVALGEEGVSWFWPDLDGLAGSADPAVAPAAAEAVERLREAAFGLTG